MQTLVLRQVLRDGGILRAYLGGERPSPDWIRRRVFVAERANNLRLPDHIYRNWRDRALGECDGVWPLLRKTLSTYVDHYLKPRGDRLHVNFDRFGQWQNELAGVSPLPVIAFALAGHVPASAPNLTELERFADRYLAPYRHTCLITPFSQPIEDLIEREGLSDLHIHLNGSTEADTLWQDALADVERHRRNLSIGLRGENGCALPSPGSDAEMVAELYEQLDPDLDPEEVGRRLLIARRLRAVMAARVLGRTPPEGLPLIAELVEDRPIPFDSFIATDRHPLPKLLGIGTLGSGLMDEIALLVLVYAWMKRYPADETLANALHIYLLILNATFVPLCVQMAEQFGFDQFQKFTFNAMRWLSETEYTHRFHQLCNGAPGDLSFLEGRFAPAGDVPALKSQLTNILSGYNQFLAQGGQGDTGDGPVSLEDGDEVSHFGQHRLMLRLVAHFIKRRDFDDGSSGSECRHSALRNDLAMRWDVLRSAREDFPRIRRYVTGLDAAANELHAPPEVFAPVFRAARRAGIVNLTYHVGEDFEHLLSGIRAVYESVEFLGLNDGNRIGHATAVGIDPNFWLAHVPPLMARRVGEVLDDLVFAHHLLLACPEGLVLSGCLEEEIHRLSDYVYREPLLPQTLWAAWKLRHLDPLRFTDLDAGRCVGTEDDEVEFEALRDARAESERVFRTFRRYHTPEVRIRFNHVQSFRSDEIHADLLRLLQDITLQKLVDRHVVIETLPSSNVRISFYDDFSQHHFVRWLGLNPGAKGPLPRICIGSDDPGIFACSLRGEYIHLLRETMRVAGCERTAFNHILAIHEAARLYRFTGN